MIIEELTSIITIKSEHGEWQGVFYVFDLFQDPCFTLSPYGTLFSPTGSDIYEVNGVDVHTGGGIAAMSDRVGFEKAWA